MGILIYDKAKKLTRYKEGHQKMIKGSIHQEDKYPECVYIKQQYHKVQKVKTERTERRNG